MITVVHALLGSLVFFLLALPVGMVIAHFFLKHHLNSLSFFVKTPLYVAIGLATITTLTFLVGYVTVSIWVILLISAGFTALGIARLWRGRSLYFTSEYFSRQFSKSDGFFLFLFLLSLIHFSIIAGYLKWASPADPIRDGELVSLILFQGRIPFNYSPISTQPISYPLGFHILSAYLSLFLNVFPGEAIFITGTFIVALLPSLVASAVYIRTSSKIFSSLAFLSVFLIHPLPEPTLWVVGYFYNSTLTVLLATVFFLAIFLILCITPAHISNSMEGIKFLGLLGLFSLAIGITYPSFAPFLLVLIGMWGIINRVIVKQALSKLIKNYLKYLLFLIISVMIIIVVSVLVLVPLALRIILPGPAGYNVDPAFFFNNAGGLVILFSPLMAFLLWRHNRELWGTSLLLYSFVLFAVVFSLIPLFKLYVFSYILPLRSLMLLMLMSWILFASYLHLGYVKLHQMVIANTKPKQLSISRLGFNQSFYPRSAALTLLALGVTGGLFCPPLYPHFSLALANQWGWYQRMDYFTDDYRVCSWIAYHVPSTELILNDPSYMGYYLLSFGIRNVIYSITANQTRAQVCWELWLHADNATLVRELLLRYQIKYIFSPSEWGIWNRSTANHASRYVGKPHRPDEYKDWFASYSFLNLVFESRDSAIFQVLEEELN